MNEICNFQITDVKKIIKIVKKAEKIEKKDSYAIYKYKKNLYFLTSFGLFSVEKVKEDISEIHPLAIIGQDTEFVKFQGKDNFFYFKVKDSEEIYRII